MAKKRGNRKYNPLKSVEQIASAGLSDMVVTFNAEEDKCKVFDVKKSKFYDPISPNLFKAIWNVRHYWRMYLVAVIREKNGKEAVIHKPTCVPGEEEDEKESRVFPVFQTEIEESLTKQHKKFVQSEIDRGNTILNVGWIGDPKGKNKVFNTSEVTKILTEMRLQ